MSVLRKSKMCGYVTQHFTPKYSWHKNYNWVIGSFQGEIAHRANAPPKPNLVDTKPNPI